jgi:uncharacterized protein involved in type VI secretion and phage assembly
VYPAIVTSLVADDKGIGRIELKFPWLGESGAEVRALATLCTPYADDGQGFEFLPAVDSQVVVGFEAGDVRRPYILGSCWNGKERLPVKPAEPNNKRVIKTRSGSLLEFDDSKGAAKITLSMKGGHKLVLDDGGSTITVSHKNGSSLKFEKSGNVTLTAASKLVINASAVQVNAASDTHTGSITCTALTATSVTSPIYSLGAGNIW